MKFSNACFNSGEDWSSALPELVDTAWLRCAASHSAAALYRVQPGISAERLTSRHLGCLDGLSNSLILLKNASMNFAILL